MRDVYILNNEEGFTFVEVLVAIVLVILTLIPVMDSYLNMFSIPDKISEKRKVINLAQIAADEFTYLYRNTNLSIIEKKNYWNNGVWRNDYELTNSDEYQVNIEIKEKATDYRLVKVTAWLKKDSGGQNTQNHNVELETLIKNQ